WAMLMQEDKAREGERRSLESREVFRRAFLLVILAALTGMALIAVSIYLCYGFADALARILGEAAMSVIIRLSAFLLVCIGVQIVWNGISPLLSPIPLPVG